MGFKFNPITGNLDLVGSGSSAPTGTANRFAYFNGTTALASLNNWIVNTYSGSEVSQAPSFADSGIATARIFEQRTLTILPTTNLTTDYLYGELSQTGLETTFDYTNGFTNHEQMVQQNGLNDIGGELINYFPRLHLGVGGLSTSNNSWVIKANNRISSTHTASGLNGIEAQVSMDGGSTAFQARSLIGSTYVGGTADYARGLDQSVQVDGSIVNNVYGIALGMFAGVGSTIPSLTAYYSNSDLDIAGDYTGLRLGYTGDIGTTSNDIDIYHEGVVTGNANAIAVSRNGANSQSYNFLNFAFNNVSPTTNSLTVLNYGNASTIGDGFTGININQTGVVSDSFQGMNIYVGANVGNGGGDNLNAVNINVDSITLDGNANYFNILHEANTTGPNNNNVTGFNFDNNGLGYRLTALRFYNNQDQDEEIRGIQIQNDNADARTKTLIDLQSSGNTTDDFQAFRINMSSETSSSTTQHPASIVTAGGILGIQSTFSPFSSFGVDIGNNITATSTVPLGSPLTGTDQFITFIQSNLLANDDIATGPFGLDTNMIGAVSQVAVGSTKTVPLLRSMLLGTSVPTGSGGTITEHVVLEILGLPSFGGSVTCPTKIGIQDSTLLGQNFSDGATNVWGIRWRDVNSEHYLARLALNTTSLTCSTNVRLEVKNGHIKSDQTTPPSVAPNANAGTGAITTLARATDTAGEVTLETGSAALALGPQLTVTFNQVYNSIPIVVLQPANANAANAEAVLEMYVTATTANFTINLNNPAIASTTYVWDYHIIETY